MPAVDAPFVDGHVHFWKLADSGVEYAWLGPGTTHPTIGDIEGLKTTRFAAEEFISQSRFQRATKAIHVGVSTNADPVAETEWLQSVADVAAYPQGIVAKCDLASPDAPSTLARHLESRNMRGVRDNGYPGSFRDPMWRDGYRHLAAGNLVFCHEVGVARMAEAVELVRAIPEVTFCVDHCGMPRDLSAEGFEAWRAALISVAEAPNVVVKISALGQWGGRWTLESVRPWVSTCIEAFGTDRAFFGSNFPVDGLFSSYGDLVGAFRSLIADFSPAEQRAMLSENAERIFRI